MLPASVKGPGMNMGFPDVCLTPSVPSPIPVPYPNLGMHAMAAPFCATILLGMMPALNQGSILPMTMGDEGGLAHPFFKQMGMFTMGSPKVILQGMPAITLTCPTTGNNMNNPLGMVTVPGAPNVLYGRAGPCPEPGAERPIEAQMLNGGVARVAIRVFSAAAPAAFHAAIARLSRDGIAQIHIDLRDNPGGEVGAAIELLRDLLPEGATVARIEDSDGDELLYRARGDAYPYPLVVRVNRGTASAAELFAGCLQVHGRALVVGERTYGKSAARAVIGSSLVDVARVRLPDGRDIGGAGVVPDVEEG